MTAMNKADYQLFTTIAKMNQKSLWSSMKNYLKKYYTEGKLHITMDYLFCEGNIPIMVVSHMDTVFKETPEKIFYDEKQKTMWSPQGLGADDRAGVFSILKLIQYGYRPYICLTTDEEIGGIGASNFVKDYPTCNFDIKYIVELDRQGICDCVFYSCANEKFQDFVESFGFVTDIGTFTDISYICPTWGIAGVNLSVGYKNEHSAIETLNTDAMYTTIKKVRKMMDSINDAEYFEYIPDPYMNYYDRLFGKGWKETFPSDYDYDYDWWDSSKYNTSDNKEEEDDTNKCKCTNCHKDFPFGEVFQVKSRKYKDAKNYYCLDCIGFGVNWCEKCGQPFEVDNANDTLCPDCAGKKLTTISVM